MAVVREFTLPDLGEGLTEAEIVRWLVAVGEVVTVDQPVVEVETAKAVVEVPCPYGGVVTARYGEEGQSMDVGRPLLTVAVGTPIDGLTGPPEPAAPVHGVNGVDGSHDIPAHGTPAHSEGDDGPADGAGSGNVLVGYGTGGAAARRRRRVRAGAASVGGGTPVSPAGPTANAAGPDPALNHDSAPNPAAVLTATSDPAAGPDPAPTAPASPEGPVAVVSPLVRRLAREHGVDLRALTGSGPRGLVLRADVERAIAAATTRAVTTRAVAPDARVPGADTDNAADAATHTHAAADAAHTAPEPGTTRVPLRGMRRAVAEKMSRSRREIPDATCWVDADATELLAARAAMNAAGDAPAVPVSALLARICCAALARFPDLNAWVDAERGEIVRLADVGLGFAAQTPRGLVVPVVRDAGRCTTAALAEEMTRLTGAAREGRLRPEELTGGTFTLNNYGVFGVDGSTPIINHPEAAMLGVGRITPRPWVHEGGLAVRQVVQLSFTFDHRVCDGGTAGGFLRFVADCVESPAVLLREV
jgi:pyruvate dehydrogenase E2 component (dihydrolipoamide acetyltransferase)